MLISVYCLEYFHIFLIIHMCLAGNSVRTLNIINVLKCDFQLCLVVSLKSESTIAVTYFRRHFNLTSFKLQILPLLC